jgi:hypothetical protein
LQRWLASGAEARSKVSEQRCGDARARRSAPALSGAAARPHHPVDNLTDNVFTRCTRSLPFTVVSVSFRFRLTAAMGSWHRCCDRRAARRSHTTACVASTPITCSPSLRIRSVGASSTSPRHHPLLSSLYFSLAALLALTQQRAEQISDSEGETSHARARYRGDADASA